MPRRKAVEVGGDKAEPVTDDNPWADEDEAPEDTTEATPDRSAMAGRENTEG